MEVGDAERRKTLRQQYLRVNEVPGLVTWPVRQSGRVTHYNLYPEFRRTGSSGVGQGPKTVEKKCGLAASVFRTVKVDN